MVVVEENREKSRKDNSSRNGQASYCQCTDGHWTQVERVTAEIKVKILSGLGKISEENSSLSLLGIDRLI